MMTWAGKLVARLPRRQRPDTLPGPFESVVNRFFDESSRPQKGKQPELVLLYGCVCSGKTTYRRTHLASGYVALDAGDVFAEMGCGDADPFPPADPVGMNQIGSAIARRALREQRSLVLELVSNYPEQLDEVLAAIQLRGYLSKVTVFDCTPEEAARRNQGRGADGISAYHAQRFHVTWLLSARV